MDCPTHSYPSIAMRSLALLVALPYAAAQPSGIVRMQRTFHKDDVFWFSPEAPEEGEGGVHGCRAHGREGRVLQASQANLAPR